MFFSATGKYINPTRLQLIVEVKSSTHLSIELSIERAFVARIKFKNPNHERGLATIGRTSTLSIGKLPVGNSTTTTSRQKEMPQLGRRRRRSHFLRRSSNVCSTEFSTKTGGVGRIFSTIPTTTLIQHGHQRAVLLHMKHK